MPARAPLAPAAPRARARRRAASRDAAAPRAATCGCRDTQHAPPSPHPDSFKEGKGEIELPEISTPVLERTIAYWMFKVKYHGAKLAIPEFVIPPDMALALLIAADYLEC